MEDGQKIIKASPLSKTGTSFLCIYTAWFKKKKKKEKTFFEARKILYCKCNWNLLLDDMTLL